MTRKRRWRGLCVEQRGWRVARIEDRETGEQIGVYKRLGKWRLYRNDDPVRDAALAGCARRMLAR